MIDAIAKQIQPICWEIWKNPAPIIKHIGQSAAFVALLYGAPLLLSSSCSASFSIVSMARQNSPAAPIVAALEIIDQLSWVKPFLSIAGTLTVGLIGLTAAAYSYPSFLISSAQNKGAQLKEAVDALRKQGAPGWQEFAAKMIRQQRYDQPELELARLIGAGIITPEIRRRIEALSEHKSVHVLQAQALELQNLYADTHYMFLHAYSGPFYPIAVAAKEQAKLASKEHYPHYKFLRSPNLKISNMTLEDFKKNPRINDHNSLDRELLLSVSACLFDQADCESALYFLNHNTNVSSDASHILMNFHGFQQTEADRLRKMSCKNNFRNLVVYFIPKDKLGKMAYKAHPFGEVCNCFNADQQKARLERWQAGIMDPEDFCKVDMSSQFRLWLPSLNPEECRVYMLSTQSKEARREIKQETKQALIRANL